MDLKLLRGVVALALKVGIFNPKMYRAKKILTSHGIQMRYRALTQRRAGNPIRTEYDLSDGGKSYHSFDTDDFFEAALKAGFDR